MTIHIAIKILLKQVHGWGNILKTAWNMHKMQLKTIKIQDVNYCSSRPFSIHQITPFNQQS